MPWLRGVSVCRGALVTGESNYMTYDRNMSHGFRPLEEMENKGIGLNVPEEGRLNRPATRAVRHRAPIKTLGTKGSASVPGWHCSSYMELSYVVAGGNGIQDSIVGGSRMTRSSI